MILYLLYYITLGLLYYTKADVANYHNLEVYSLKVLKVKSLKSRCPKGCTLFRGSGGHLSSSSFSELLTFLGVSCLEAV